jgi:NADPH:quinone reductase-like Zn-dependent oxidoreductase
LLTITQSAFGPPEVLHLVETQRPRTLPTEVLVRVSGIGVNPVDAAIRAGKYQLLGPPPFVLGWDISGTVEEVVPGTVRFKVGDEVYGLPFFPRAARAYAQYVAAPSRMFAKKPFSLDHTEAAAIPLAGLTAWQALVEHAQVGPSDTVLIHGAGGGVGHLAVQIARCLGAYVVCTASAGKHDFLKRLGASLVIDYRSVDFATVVRDVSVVFDLVGSGYAKRSFRCMRPGAVFVTAVSRDDGELADQVVCAGFRFSGVAVEPDYVGLEALAELADTGRLRPHVGHVFALSEAAEAHRLIELGHMTGKIVLAA